MMGSHSVLLFYGIPFATIQAVGVGMSGGGRGIVGLKILDVSLEFQDGFGLLPRNFVDLYVIKRGRIENPA